MLMLLCLSNFSVLFLFQLFNFKVGGLIVWEPKLKMDAATPMRYVTEAGEKWKGFRMGA